VVQKILLANDAFCSGNAAASWEAVMSRRGKQGSEVVTSSSSLLSPPILAFRSAGKKAHARRASSTSALLALPHRRDAPALSSFSKDPDSVRRLRRIWLTKHKNLSADVVIPANNRQVEPLKFISETCNFSCLQKKILKIGLKRWRKRMIKNNNT